MRQSGIFLKMQLQGESWENLGELGRAAEICGDLWGAVEGACAVGIVGVSSALHEIKRKRTCDVPAFNCSGLYHFVAGDFLWLLAAIKWSQAG